MGPRRPGAQLRTLSEITTVMAQIQAAGKITGQDLMQFGQHGLNAADLIGASMGKTAAQIKNEITAGSLDATTALDALAAGMEKRYAGAAALVKQTWAGTKDPIAGAVRDIGSGPRGAVCQRRGRRPRRRVGRQDLDHPPPSSRSCRR